MIIIKSGKYVEVLLKHPVFTSRREALVCGMTTGQANRGRRVVSLRGLELTIRVRQKGDKNE